ncbi:MAG: TetR/AcrR family transcriptional regulator [Myxococcaceae bacterium]|nr:TetR/AcrR family transcriptional regulator [Myxococcaceae bacterium]
MARPADPHARRSLVDAARAEFVKHGIIGARIEDITAACGLSKGAFYLHFKSKEALFGELVQSFQEGMNRSLDQRMQAMAGFFAEHGAITARDLQVRSERYERLLELEGDYDRNMLSLIWEYRDLMRVLVSGSQGTGFSSLIWEIANREVQRVQDEFETMKSLGACRTDVPSELFGSMLVGTWLLVAQRMSQLSKKPDLDVWVESLHRLIREGAAPQKVKSGKKTTRRKLAAREASL